MTLGAFLIATTFVVANNNDPINKDKTEPVVNINTLETIVGVAVSNAEFSTLVAVVKAADLLKMPRRKSGFFI